MQASLDNIPELLKSTAELENDQCLGVKMVIKAANLSTGNAGAEWVVADADFFVYIGVCEVISSSSHCAYEYGDVVRSWKGGKVA